MASVATGGLARALRRRHGADGVAARGRARDDRGRGVDGQRVLVLPRRTWLFGAEAATRDPVNGDLITLDYKHAEITARQRAMLDYARVLTVAPAELEEADLEALREHGLSDEDMWDVIEIAAMFNFTNRMAHGAGMLPNPEYHALAR